MCYSASVSYTAAVVLVSTGAYAVQQARQLHPPHWLLWALIPVFFGVQQAFEGRVWQELGAAGTGAGASSAIPFALGFHFFSHFLWLWLLPLCSYLVEPGKIRRRIIAGFAIFGAFAGTMVYSAMLFHPEWMSVAVREHSIVYRFTAPYESPIKGVPITPVTLYGLTVLGPLFTSSHKLIRLFGFLVLLSMALASVANDAAFVSVWCFFAAILSLYLVFMIRHYATKLGSANA